MSKKYPPLTPREVIEILTKRGFVLDNKVGSHYQYTGVLNGKKHRVTVDVAEREYGDFLIRSMISQSGMTRDEFYCSTKATAKKVCKPVLEF